MSTSDYQPPQLNWVTVGAGKLTLYHRPKRRDFKILPSLGCTQVITLLSAKEGALVIGKRVEEAKLI